MENTEEKKEVRVRFYMRDEIIEGTLVKEEINTYLVIPDYNLNVTTNWLKRHCDIIK